MKKLKQGQTVYMLDLPLARRGPVRIITMFLHSQKTELPLEECIIRKWPVDFVRTIMAREYAPRIYFSRRRVESALKAIRL